MPPESSNLEAASNTPQFEFDEAIYPCQSGHTLGKKHALKKYDQFAL